MPEGVFASTSKILTDSEEREDTLSENGKPEKPKSERAKKREEEDRKHIAEERRNWLYYTRNPLTDNYRDNLYKEYYTLSVLITFRGNDNDKMLGVSLKFKDPEINWEARITNLESFLFYAITGEKQVINSNEITIELEDLTSADAKLVRYLDSIFRDGEHLYDNGKLWLKNQYAEGVINILKEHPSVFVEGKPAIVSDQVVETIIKGELDKNGTLTVTPALMFKMDEGQAQPDINFEKLCTFGRSSSYIFYRGSFHFTRPSFGRTKKDLFPNDVIIDKKYVNDFYARVLPALKKDFHIDIPESEDFSDMKVFPATVVVYLDYDGKSVFAAVKFKYGRYTVDPYTSKATSADGEVVTGLYRDIEKEQFYCHMLSRFLDRTGEYSFETSDDEKIFYLSYKALPRLQDKNWTFYYSEAFRSLRLGVKPPKMKIKLTRDIDFFSIDFSFDGVEELKDLSELIKEVQAGKEYIRLQNGSFVPVDLEVIDYIAKIMSETTSTQNSEDSYLIPLFNAPYFVEELEKNHGVEIGMSEEANKTLRQIKETEYDENLPKELVGTPRPYQLTGYHWLRKLASMGLNGILADDMGLGKSFQTIATVLKEKEDGANYPTLIVCPTSCVFNWYMELQKFAPTLNVSVIQGTLQKREKMIRAAMNYDVIVTSYASLRRDVKRYAQQMFNYVILDEAQHIKNANTQNAKAAKALKSDRRLVLTGTPMENSITELWSIFDFLMPGFFPRHSHFVDLYETPILNDSDESVLETLRRKIAPFILRRLKKDVLTELPPKNTNVVYCEMSPSQKELYLSILDAAKMEIFDIVKKKGFNNAKIEIFSALTRLRQVCCHPALMDMKLRGDANTSGKFNLFIEMIMEALDGGHNVIVFSQFTKMLMLISKALEKKAIEHFYLDGSTKDRMDLVNRFNAGERPIFLLSLKAAGTGLTLTKADTVIHYDLWWNPAVEDQATDRAYRLGQQREVTNYKLVTKGTIEEKILHLQDKKRELIDSVIDAKAMNSGSIGWEEVKSLLE